MTVADKLDKVDRLLSEAARATADREHGLAIGCTEWQAAWCPVHGDCCCENDEDWRPGTNGCKLHLPDTPIGFLKPLGRYNKKDVEATAKMLTVWDL